MATRVERVDRDGSRGVLWRVSLTESLFVAEPHIENVFLELLNANEVPVFSLTTYPRGDSLASGRHVREPEMMLNAMYRNGKLLFGSVYRTLYTDDPRFPNGTMPAGFRMYPEGEVRVFMGIGTGKLQVLPFDQHHVTFSEEHGGFQMRSVAGQTPLLYARRHGVTLWFGKDARDLMDVNFHTAGVDALAASRLLRLGISMETSVDHLLGYVQNIRAYILDTPRKRR